MLDLIGIELAVFWLDDDGFCLGLGGGGLGVRLRLGGGCSGGVSSFLGGFDMIAQRSSMSKIGINGVVRIWTCVGQLTGKFTYTTPGVSATIERKRAGDVEEETLRHSRVDVHRPPTLFKRRLKICLRLGFA